MDWNHWRDENLAGWENRVDIHTGPKGYDVQRLLSNPGARSAVVMRDEEVLGNVAGLDVLHLQCHIGTDTLSLWRLGAKSITGLDFSPKALAHCRWLFEQAGAKGTFVLSDVMRAREALSRDFDLVYASLGAINWIPSIGRWIAEAAAVLRPGGRLYLRDVHPMSMVLDPDVEPEFRLRFPYGETVEPVTLESDQTYIGDGTPLIHRKTHEWSHGLGEIVQGALDAGLVITGLAEHFYTEWQAFPSMIKLEDGRWVLPDRPERLPLLFTLQAMKPQQPDRR